MKNIICLLIVSVIVFLTHPAHAIVGYVNRTFGVGQSLFANPLQASSHTLNSLFSPASVPNGTQISLWNPTTGVFDTTSTLVAGSWSINFTLNPGTGARLTTSSVFTNTFVGEVLNHNGIAVGFGSFTPPPVFGGPNGIYLLGDKAPFANTGADIFLNILGRGPNVGEQVITLTSTSTYLGGGNWDNIPSMAVSDAAFLNIGPVPEPTSITLSLLGFALIPICRRRQQ